MLDQIVLVHAFSKKEPQLKKMDIELAERRMEEWMRRFPAGGEERKALNLAMKIVKLREEKGLSQQQLAELMGTSRQAISRIESGEYMAFTLKTLEKIDEATGTRVKVEFVMA